MEVIQKQRKKETDNGEGAFGCHSIIHHLLLTEKKGEKKEIRKTNNTDTGRKL